MPIGDPDERELLLSWLGYLRGAIVRNVDGLSDQDGHWTPDGRLIPLLGIVNHLTHVEWRWIDGGMLGEEVSRHEEEFHPGPELTVETAVAAYRERGRPPTPRFDRCPTSRCRASGAKAGISGGSSFI